MTNWNPEGRPEQAWGSAPQHGQPQYPATSAQPGYPENTPYQPGYGQGYPQTPGYPQPPQGYAPVGPPPGYPTPRRQTNSTLIISLVVAAVLLIGGGVTAFLLINKDSDVAPAGVAAGTTSSSSTQSSSNGSTSDDPTSDDPTTDDPTTHETTSDDPTTDETTSDDPTSDDPTSDDPTSDDPTTDETSETGDGTIDTAYTLASTFVDLVNEGDLETAVILVCENEQADFFGSDLPGQIELADVTDQSPDMLMTITLVETGETAEFRMQPTDTGYFLICDGEMTDADLHW